MEMSAEQLELYKRLTALQKAFVEHLEEGFAPKIAYKMAGGRATSGTSMASCVHALLNDSNVKEFRLAMKVEDLNGMCMSRAEMTRRLSELARGRLTNIARVKKYFIGYNDEGEERYATAVEIEDFDDVDDDELACISEISQKEHGITIKTHSPLQAMKQLAELHGLDAPKRTEITGKGGTAIKITSVDPAEAAAEYQAMMG